MSANQAAAHLERRGVDLHPAGNLHHPQAGLQLEEKGVHWMAVPTHSGLGEPPALTSSFLDRVDPRRLSPELSRHDGPGQRSGRCAREHGRPKPPAVGSSDGSGRNFTGPSAAEGRRCPRPRARCRAVVRRLQVPGKQRCRQPPCLRRRYLPRRRMPCLPEEP